jgi:hypothetical protein
LVTSGTEKVTLLYKRRKEFMMMLVEQRVSKYICLGEFGSDILAGDGKLANLF